MTRDRPPARLPATPEYVLAVIRDSHRQQCQIDPEADLEADLTFETTVADWRAACDLLGWRPLGRALDGEWQLGLSDAAWCAALEPSWTRTLGDLCGFIAPRASMPSVEPFEILGASCLPAGAFLALRSALRDAGVDVDPVRPSTPLAEYARRHLPVFLGPISRLAPDALPAADVSTPWYDLSLNGLLLGLFVAAVGPWISPLVTVAGVFLAVGSYAATWATAHVLPSEVTFGKLRTFGDLARVIAGGGRAAGPRRSPAPAA